MNNKISSEPTSSARIKKSVFLCKRLLDLIIIIPIFLIILPVLIFLFIAYAISMIFFPSDRGPIIHKVFRKTRGRLFVIYKFRISRMDYLKQQKLTPEIQQQILQNLDINERKQFLQNPNYWIEDFGKEKTFFGAFLKKFYLDELPQIFNIVKGDMTFVGPRPFGISDARNLYDEEGKIYLAGKKIDYSFKDELYSGLTGYYQLNKDYRAAEDYDRFILEGIDLDRKYHNELTKLNCWQVMLKDLSIIFKTFAVIRRGEGI